MTPLQWTLAAVGQAILLAGQAALICTVWALLNGRQTVSGYLDDAPRRVVFAVGFVMGSIVFGLAAHWWWPTKGN